MEEKTTKEAIWGNIAKEIAFLSSNASEAKQLKSCFRHNIGKKIGNDPYLYDHILSLLPDTTEDEYFNQTFAENAMYYALTLYAFADNNGNDDIAKAISNIEDNKNIIKKFHIAEMSDNIDEFGNRLKGVVKLLASKEENLSYAKLASELYQWQFSKTSQMISWEKYIVLKSRKEK